MEIRFDHQLFGTIYMFACRYCHHYSPEGRRGGHCQRLNVPVRGEWKACMLMLPSFAPSWEGLDDLPVDPPLETRPVFAIADYAIVPEPVLVHSA